MNTHTARQPQRYSTSAVLTKSLYIKSGPRKTKIKPQLSKRKSKSRLDHSFQGGVKRNTTSKVCIRSLTDVSSISGSDTYERTYTESQVIAIRKEYQAQLNVLQDRINELEARNKMKDDEIKHLRSFNKTLLRVSPQKKSKKQSTQL